jgi:hypothetical protein
LRSELRLTSMASIFTSKKSRDFIIYWAQYVLGVCVDVCVLYVWVSSQWELLNCHRVCLWVRIVPLESIIASVWKRFERMLPVLATNVMSKLQRACWKDLTITGRENGVEVEMREWVYEYLIMRMRMIINVEYLIWRWHGWRRDRADSKSERMDSLRNIEGSLQVPAIRKSRAWIPLQCCIKHDACAHEVCRVTVISSLFVFAWRLFPIWPHNFWITKEEIHAHGIWNHAKGILSSDLHYLGWLYSVIGGIGVCEIRIEA